MTVPPSGALGLGRSAEELRESLSSQAGLQYLPWRQPTNSHGTPELTGAALEAVRHRGSHLQIIAGAGSGKTEVVAQRVVDLLADGVPAESIVAFTFTERAAEELKDRIARRVEDRLGREALDRLDEPVRRDHPRLLLPPAPAARAAVRDLRRPRRQPADRLPRARGKRLELRQLDPRNRLFASIAAFLKGVDVDRERAARPGDDAGAVRSQSSPRYYATLERYRLLTYGQQIVRAVDELERPELAAEVHADLRHLIVDEYQDVNPAQERLIELLDGPSVELCVVGDDEQAIYQWRGSDVENIVTSATATTRSRRSRSRPTAAAGRSYLEPPTASRDDPGAAREGR